MNKRWTSVAACLGFIVAAAGEARVHTKPEPIAGQYIVVLKDDAIPRSAVAATAMAMALQHRGRLLGSFSNGVRGFGIEMPSGEAEACRLSRGHGAARLLPAAAGRKTARSSPDEAPA